MAAKVGKFDDVCREFQNGDCLFIFSVYELNCFEVKSHLKIDLYKRKKIRERSLVKNRLI